MNGKPSRKQRVLNALRTGPKTTAELCGPDVGGERFGGRLLELRAAGYVITEQRLRQGSHLYTLSGTAHQAVDYRDELNCPRGHVWYAQCGRDRSGYALLPGGASVCPKCGRHANGVVGVVSPARADVVAKVAA